MYRKIDKPITDEEIDALPDLVSPQELADVWGTHRNCIDDKIRRGTLPAYRVGKRNLVLVKAEILPSIRKEQTKRKRYGEKTSV